MIFLSVAPLFLKESVSHGVFRGEAADKEGQPKRRQERSGRKRANIMTAFLMVTESPVSIRCQQAADARILGPN